MQKECKHRWEESNFAERHREEGHYIYECARCHKSIFATLEKRNGNTPSAS